MLVKGGFGGVEGAIGGGWGVRARVYIRVAGFGVTFSLVSPGSIEEGLVLFF